MTTDSTAPALPPTVTSRTTPAGLEVLTVANAHGTAEVYLQGAHVTAWTPAGEDPVLWLSSASAFEPGVPVRGGIPICFPWFGARDGHPEAPAHGYARRTVWTLVGAHDDHETTVLRLALAAPADPALADLSGLDALYEVRVGRTLDVALTVTSTRDVPVRFEEAQHTYLRVLDVEATAVHGLEEVAYLDKTAAAGTDPHRTPEGAPLVPSGQVDRVYLGTSGPVQVVDAARTVRVTKSSSQSTVVWSPGAEVAAGMRDMGPGEWREMVCVESANVGEHAVVLEPGRPHTLGSSYEVLPRV
ncbi:aldose 1-epimerase-like enzyme [Sanguibacter keddieii DSM 10542]|uniref:Putative glucose-6-phosphate 1-epimerase n=1 Tax=Sanguibacter keddieii (strain ATCC 51767 / DSM 10542 / NCFB 3025 / ST-74) TaxID=446469 RepID=D1BIE3_SANKS|nr:D-hexose-6-phosphate mutarotase [Sanguibacter keddieii]ACZ22120.1 aldose 1-epimerase-like enzyme [Sanguibacter keddieii DSM 10542]